MFEIKNCEREERDEKAYISRADFMPHCLNGIPVYAGDGYGKELEQAILTVKTIVEIPEEYKEFSYYTYENETESGAQVLF